MVTDELGAWLRREREARSWTRTEMARRLIKAARATGDTTMPSADNISHNIYRWERGVINPSERYKLHYCHAFGISSSDSGTTLGQQENEKAQRWDHLVELLKSGSLQDTYVLHLSTLRRATLMLLASREELPETLVAELSAYRTRLDALYLEAGDGFQDAKGILNALPTHVSGSALPVRSRYAPASRFRTLAE